MKMTMHIDEALLEEVMEMYGFETKTDAVDFALRELNRRKKLRAFMKEGLGLSEDELKSAVYPDYDLKAMRVAEVPTKGEK
ncbi:type II toxin-antitoxin system VapB family antitoxin [Sulfuriroseicoccus oceanibius]|uniref:Type II toxin-antitoxin system VapB family antitoxin n=1 Tax=Sulfuriroseicoccus oceanibius TaxID=2707525 RepID=A0A6B3LD20_9BACT|nr:type II toxin-antitoxin system VapB family antitoxin [Sulfuriroseicoccus oceanibius]QQL44737.1 type II toxin-antitoxin system VapB family antitoxin [Sulfuriroseicoccus oceanibius]